MKHAASSGLLKAQEHSRFKSGFDPRRKAPRLLSEADVKSIRNRNLTGETFRDISKDYPVDESSIRRCCKRQTYKDII